MERILLHAKVKASVVHAKQELDLDRRKAFERQLYDAVLVVQTAILHTSQTIESLLSSLDTAHKALVSLASIGECHAQLTAALQLAASALNAAQQSILPTLSGAVDREWSAPIESLTADVALVSDLRNKRHDAVNKHETSKVELKEKEAACAKKGKNITSSKTYGQVSAKNSKYQADAAAACEEYEAISNDLFKRKTMVTAQVWQSFLFRVSEALGTLSSNVASALAVSCSGFEPKDGSGKPTRV